MVKHVLHFTLLWLALPAALQAADTTAEDLPFDRQVINRYSLDHLPRSLSIRQGSGVWLGYDLERAKLYKAWQAPADGSGLKSSGFVVRSVGTTWFEDKSDDVWQLQRDGKSVPLAIRYLGCSQRQAHFELSWELKHDAGLIQLVERIPVAAASEPDRVRRDIRAQPLAAGETLLLPPAAGQSWQLTTHDGTATAALTGTQWHRITLP